MVIELIKAGSREKDLIDYKGENAVYLAIEQGEVHSVQALLNSYEFEISNFICEKILLMGCYGNKLLLVKNTLSRLPKTHKIREDGLSPLLITYSLGFEDITNELINCSLNEEVDFISNQGEFLLIAACRNNNMKIVEAIVEKNCNLSLKDSNGRTALHEACAKGHIEILHILLRRRLDLNSQDIFGNTPVILACKNNFKYSVEVLAKRGADLQIKDYSGKSIRQYANKDIIEILDNLSVVKRKQGNRRQRTIYLTKKSK